MQIKAIWTRISKRIAEAWKAGRIQRNSRITYDVIWNLFLFFLLLAGVGIFFVVGAGAGYFASLVKGEPVLSYDTMKEEVYNYEETSSIYFADNVFLGNIKTDLYREDVKLDEISPYVINGIIATEDDNFETHNGVVPKSILRALMQEATNSETKTGGSTLTQQLVKNQILTNEVSFERKAKEIILAMRLEKVLSKDEILEAYLNIVPFGRNASGNNIAGVQTAAQGIFGVDAKDLTLPQAAFLAGLPQSPSAYSPFTNSGELKEETALQPGLNRMKQVLNRMLDEGYIDQQEYDDAIGYDITKDFAEAKPVSDNDYGYLTTEVEQRAAGIIAIQLAEQDGHSKKELDKDNDLKNEYLEKAERDIRQKGYQIHTTINKDMYVAQQKIAKEYAYYQPDHWVKRTNGDGETETVSEPIEAGSIMIENSTGKILSFVGGRDYEKNQVNHATDTKRSNGSTMKPLLVYAPAMEEGTLQPGTVIGDLSKKFTVPGQSKTWNPGNYGGVYHGLVTARKALEESYNVPAAKAYKEIVNLDPASKYLEKMGITTLTEGDHSNLAASLGGLDYGTTVEENVNAYATFGNNGEFTDAYMIESITTKDGEEIYKHESKQNKVFSPQTNYLMLDMMRGVLDNGTATYAKSQLSNKNVDWAGKTGTSQDYHDSWFVATNPNVTVGVWMGYDKQDSIQTSGMGYSQRNQLLWTQLVNSATKIDPELMAPSESFKQPDGLTKASYCAIGGGKPTELCKQAGMVKTDLFDKDHVPTKADDSLIKQNGKIVLNPDFVKENGLQGVSIEQLFPNNEKVQKLIGKAASSSASAKSDDSNAVKTSSGAPLPPTNVQKADKKLTWTQSKTEDVKGYRILQKQGDSFKQIGFSNQSSFHLPDNDSTYQIKAVGADGKESETITL